MIFKFLRLIYQFSKATLGMALVRVTILILRCVTSLNIFFFLKKGKLF